MKFYNEETGDVYVGKLLFAIFIALCFLTVVGIPLWFLQAGYKVATTPARVIDRTFDTDNVINSYEDFRDTYQAYNARVAQIHDFETQKPEDRDDAEHLRVEIAGQRQSCRELVARYNSNSSKANHNIFKMGGGALPNELDMEECNR